MKVIESPLDIVVPDEVGITTPVVDTGRGELRLTDVDAKLRAWACRNQLELPGA